MVAHAQIEQNAVGKTLADTDTVKDKHVVLVVEDEEANQQGVHELGR